VSRSAGDGQPTSVTEHRNADGVPVLTYVTGTRDGRPWADRVEVIGPRPVEVILTAMVGWALSCDEDLAGELVARGAIPVRYGHRMWRDLSAAPPPPGWAKLRPAGRLRITGRCPPEDLLPAWRAAYPPGHPDHFPGDDATALRERLVPLFAGTAHGPPLHCGAVIDGDRVVAAAVINQVAGAPPWGGSWLTELFRHPHQDYAGLGTLLLRRTLARVALAGLVSIGLVVTRTNPARRLYDRHGFRSVRGFVTVLVPGADHRG
jgi:GNAT superfamily N-acetyltransferase